jgi:hypothetical protein
VTDLIVKAIVVVVITAALIGIDYWHSKGKR